MLDENDVQENNRTLMSCKIDWRIENFSLGIRMIRNILLSPEFNVRGNNNFTKWIMHLEVNRVEGEDGVILFGLKRLPDQGPSTISLNWEVTLKAGTKSFEPIENIFSFEVDSTKEFNLQTVTEVLGYLLPLEADVIVLECFALVHDEEESTNQSVPPVPGLKYLSEGLHRLKTQNINALADVIIKVGDREIQAHKAILSRNNVFDKYIDKARKNVIELPNLDYEAVDKFITFLYSGNIDDVLAKPSVSMMKCVEHFNNELLKYYYIPEELNLSTLINAETHDFRWTVSDFPTDRNACVVSAPIRRHNVDTTWRLTISVHHKRYRENDDCISLYAEIIGGERPSCFCLEFGVENQAEEVVNAKRIIRLERRYDNLGFRNFIKKSDLNSSIYVDETIKIVFRIRTFNGSILRSIKGRNLSKLPSTVNSYEQLSLDMMNLLKTKIFSDMIIKFNNKLYYAHSCVLAPRSIEFSRIISSMSSTNNVVTLEQIEDDTLEPILEYLYGGTLTTNDQDEVVKIYDSALALGIQCLIEECQRVLNAAGQNV